MSRLLQVLLLAVALSTGARGEPTVEFDGRGAVYGEDGILQSAEPLSVRRDPGEGVTVVRVVFSGGGSAEPDVDFVADPVELTFAEGETEKEVPLAVIQDELVELDETVEVGLEVVSDGSAEHGMETTTVLIRNDDQATLSIDDVSGEEGNDGGYKWFHFTVRLSHPVDVPIEFLPQLVSSDPTESLIAFWSRNFFPPENPQIHRISVSVRGDSIVELDEQFTITLVDLVTRGRDVSFADNQGMGTILNDDTARLSVVGVDQPEGDAGSSSMRLTVTLDKPVDAPVSFRLLAETGSATASRDFEGLDETLTLEGVSKVVWLPVFADNEAESDEFINVILASFDASGRDVRYGDRIDYPKILDDDFNPIALSDGPYRVVEDGSLAVDVSNGILGNDYDRDDGDGPDHLSVGALVEDVEHGTLDLRPDGSFTYLPDADFFGADQFIYKASDGTNVYGRGVVRIEVEPQVDLAVGVDVLGDPLVAGGPGLEAFRLTVTNLGPSDAMGVGLRTRRLLPGIQIAGWMATHGSYSGNWWNLGSLPEGASATLTVELSVEEDAEAEEVPLRIELVSVEPREVNEANNSASATVSVIRASDMELAVASPPRLERQSGLWVGRVTVTNHNLAPVPAFRLHVSGLPADVRVFNAQGTGVVEEAAGATPYLLWNHPLAGGESVTLTVEFYRSTREGGFLPEYRIELLPVPETLPASADAGIPVTRNVRLSNGDHLIEIASIPGTTYAVEYSGDMSGWTRVMPRVTAVANRLQWIDRGPPKTTGHPSSVPARYYRFVEIPPGSE